jgi:hypothetical protein
MIINASVMKLIGVATVAVFASGCAARTGPTLGPVPIEARLLRDNGGGIRSSSERVIRDAAAWQQVWSEATSSQATPPPLPDVDFNRQMLLVVSAGRMSVVDGVSVDSVGTRAELTEAGRRQDVLAVYYTVLRGCPPSTREAYPVEIVRVRKFDGNVRFVAGSAPGAGCRAIDYSQPPEPHS